MNHLVQFHGQVEEDLHQWLAGPDDDDENRRALVRVYIEELGRRLREQPGIPPEAVRIGRSEPTSYRWRYTSEAVVEFQVRPASRRFPRRRRFRIIVTRIRLAYAE